MPLTNSNSSRLRKASYSVLSELQWDNPMQYGSPTTAAPMGLTTTRDTSAKDTEAISLLWGHAMRVRKSPMT